MVYHANVKPKARKANRVHWNLVSSLYNFRYLITPWTVIVSLAFAIALGIVPVSAAQSLSIKNDNDNPRSLTVDRQELDPQVVSEVNKGIFRVNPFGAAEYKMVLELPPAPGSAQPNLALVYNSLQGDGPIGIGWSLEGLSTIARVPQIRAVDEQLKQVDFSSDDRFALDGLRLVAIKGAYGKDGAEYRTEKETFTRVVSEGSGPNSFRVRTREGTILDFGLPFDLASAAPSFMGSTTAALLSSSVSQSTFPGDVQPKNRHWLVSRITDRYGNYTLIEYSKLTTKDAAYPAEWQSQSNDIDIHPQRILYGGNEHAGVEPAFEIQFYYEERPDKMLGFFAGAPVGSVRRLREISISKIGGELIRSYQLTYLPVNSPPHLKNRSQLQGITECDAANHCKVPTLFQWPKYAPGYLQKPTGIAAPSLSPRDLNLFPVLYDPTRTYVAADLNGDGKAELIYLSNHAWHIAEIEKGITHSSGITVSRFFEENGGFIKRFDYNVDGLDDILLFDCGRTLKVLLSTSTRNGNISLLRTDTGIQSPGGACADAPKHVLLNDFTGDGLSDLLIRTHYYPTTRWELHIHDGKTLSPQGIDMGPEFGLRTAFPVINIDVDGDGAIELIGEIDYQIKLISLKDGEAIIKSAGLDISRDVAAYRVLDVNGDGLDDIVASTEFSKPVFVWFNTGNGFHGGDSESRDAIFAFREDISIPEYQVASLARSIVFDYDNDGRDDLFMPPTKTVSSTWMVMRATGSLRRINTIDDQFPFEYINTGIIYHPNFMYPARPIWSYHRPVVGDFNGDTLLEVLYIANDEFILMQSPFNNKRWPQIEAISEGVPEAPNDVSFVRSYRISYESCMLEEVCIHNRLDGTVSSADYPAYEGKPAVHVVSYVSIPNYSGDISFQYGNSRFDRFGRGWLGFGDQKAMWMMGLDNVTYISYDNVTYNKRHRTYPFIGLPEVVINATFKNNSSAMDISSVRSQNTMITTRSGKTYFPIESSSRLNRHFIPVEDVATSLDINFPEVVAEADPYQTTLTSSSWDMFGNITRYSIKYESGPEQEHTFEYRNDAEAWLIGLVTKHTLTALGTEVKTRTLNYVYDERTGALRESSTQDGVTGKRLVTRIHDRDLYGNPLKIQVGDGSEIRQTSFEFDERGAFPIMINDPGGFIHYFNFDSITGRLNRYQDPSGRVATWSHDNFGRLKEYTSLAGKTSTIYYSTNSLRDFTVRTPGFPDRLIKLDWDGDIQQIGAKNSDGNYVYREVKYDVFGNPESFSLPYLVGETPRHPIRYEYDFTGKLVSVSNVEEGRVIKKNLFEGNVTREIDMYGNTRRIAHNEVGLIESIVDALGQGVRFDYDSFWQLAKVIRSDGTLVTTTSDAFGRSLKIEDPNFGQVSYKYNAFGELTHLHRNNDLIEQLSYDSLGRVISRKSTDGSASWTYWWETDLPTKTQSEDGHTQTFEYDSFGRLSQTIYDFQTVPPSRLSTQNSYDTFGRLKSVEYPSLDGNGMPLTLEYVYNDEGYLSDVLLMGSELLLFHVNTYDRLGNIGDLTYGNGARSFRSYNELTGKLEVTQDVLNFQQLLSITFNYDLQADLKGLVDNLHRTSETYNYDSLSRLSSLQQGEKIFNFTYDVHGNLRSKPSIKTLTSDLENPYWLTATNKGSYTHSDSGVVLEDPNARYFYSSRQRLRSIMSKVQGLKASYQYFSDDTLALMNNGNETRLHLRDDFQRHLSADGTVSDHIIVRAEGLPLVLVSTGGETGKQAFSVRYYHRDRLGSVYSVSNERGEIETVFAYDSFGVRTLVSGQVPPVDFGYVGSEVLWASPSTLSIMGARLYDAEVGRFISPDPLVQLPITSQSLNRFAYAANDPINLVDRSGLFASGAYDYDSSISFSTISGNVSSITATNDFNWNPAAINQNFNISTETSTEFTSNLAPSVGQRSGHKLITQADANNYTTMGAPSGEDLGWGGLYNYFSPAIEHLYSSLAGKATFGITRAHEGGVEHKISTSGKFSIKGSVGPVKIGAETPPGGQGISSSRISVGFKALEVSSTGEVKVSHGFEAKMTWRFLELSGAAGPELKFDPAERAVLLGVKVGGDVTHKGTKYTSEIKGTVDLGRLERGGAIGYQLFWEGVLYNILPPGAFPYPR